ncbi:unnamed protein product [Cyprideis torosa]|uniref:Uncharacterized protein n=1 Tax=Cyprideis torosa TaxID=163714 RepID=A0A7R8WC77_9CRUS|nr:unnamed protein product [Cyprideis torosa]CAG0893141.1 unnamed protein product [Cyprideis torosa]
MGRPVVKGCCCWSLRTGTILIGVAHLIVAHFFLYENTNDVIQWRRKQPKTEYPRAEPTNKEEQEQLFLTRDIDDWMETLHIWFIIRNILDIPLNIMLIHGARTSRPPFVLLWLMWMTLALLLTTIFALLVIVLCYMVHGCEVLLKVKLYILFLNVDYTITFVIVYSFYQILKARLHAQMNGLLPSGSILNIGNTVLSEGPPPTYTAAVAGYHQQHTAPLSTASTNGAYSSSPVALPPPPTSNDPSFPEEMDSFSVSHFCFLLLSITHSAWTLPNSTSSTFSQTSTPTTVSPSLEPSLLWTLDPSALFEVSYEVHVYGTSPLTGSKNRSVFKLKEVSDSSSNLLAMDITEQHPNTSRNRRCIWNPANQAGQVMEGIECWRTMEFPDGCLCPGASDCLPLVRLSTVLELMWEQRGHVLLAHHLTHPNSDLLAVTLQIPKTHIRGLIQQEENRGVLQLRPILLHLTTEDMLPDSVAQKYGLPLEISYEIQTWNVATSATFQEAVPSLIPPGVFCSSISPDLTPLPSLPDQFSVEIETTSSEDRLVSRDSFHFNSLQRLVAFRHRGVDSGRNRSTADNSSFFLHNPFHLETSMPRKGGTDRSTVYKIVHDFKSGIEYVIDEVAGNCSVREIPRSSPDTSLLPDLKIQMTHANELLLSEARPYTYWGKRHVRGGILVDVWIGEVHWVPGTGERDGLRYSTIEIGFAHKNWTIVSASTGDRQEERVPLFITTRSAPTKSTRIKEFSKSATSSFFNFAAHDSNWEHFEISSCLTSTFSQLFLSLTLEVQYFDLVSHNLGLVLDSLRQEIAGLAGVTPLRVTDLVISGSVSSNEVDVYFRLLDRVNLTSNPDNVERPHPERSLADAYHLLSTLVRSEKDTATLLVTLVPGKILAVPIRKNSLSLVSKSRFPRKDLSSINYRFIHAGYTAGTMTGLAFSMALLGICVGVFVGFLAWKRHPGIPYLVAE